MSESVTIYDIQRGNIELCQTMYRVVGFMNKIQIFSLCYQQAVHLKVLSWKLSRICLTLASSGRWKSFRCLTSLKTSWYDNMTPRSHLNQLQFQNSNLNDDGLMNNEVSISSNLKISEDCIYLDGKYRPTKYLWLLFNMFWGLFKSLNCKVLM